MRCARAMMSTAGLSLLALLGGCSDESTAGGTIRDAGLTAASEAADPSATVSKLTPKAALSTARSPSAVKLTPASQPMTSRSGVMAKVPITLGYYVWAGDSSCANASHLLKFEPDGYWHVDRDVAESFHMEFGKVTQTKSSYFVSFGGRDKVSCEDDEPCNSGIDITPRSKNRIDITIQDTAAYSLCPIDKVPPGFIAQTKSQLK